MPEYEIALHANLRGEVLTSERTSAWRPGHRDYREGPATIRFLIDGQFDDENAPPIDVKITKVGHTQAEGKYAIYQRFLIDQGLAPDDDDRITLLEWVLP